MFVIHLGLRDTKSAIIGVARKVGIFCRGFHTNFSSFEPRSTDFSGPKPVFYSSKRACWKGLSVPPSALRMRWVWIKISASQQSEADPCGSHHHFQFLGCHDTAENGNGHCRSHTQPHSTFCSSKCASSTGLCNTPDTLAMQCVWYML